MSFRFVKNVSGHKLPRGYLAKDSDVEVDEALCAQINHLQRKMTHAFNVALFGDDEWIVKKKWYRWLKFWNWRLRLEGEEDEF